MPGQWSEDIFRPFFSAQCLIISLVFFIFMNLIILLICNSTPFAHCLPSWIFTNHRVSIFTSPLLTFLWWTHPALTQLTFLSSIKPCVNINQCMAASDRSTYQLSEGSTTQKVLSMTTLVWTSPSHWQLAHCVLCLWSGLVSLCLDSSITNLNAASSM